MTKYADFYRRSLHDRDAFWAEQAELIDWKQPPQQICDYSNPPFVRWFVGGTTNLCHNAVDRHLEGPARPGRADLRVDRNRHRENLHASASCTPRCSAPPPVLQELGVQKGDRVLIYMPMIAEAAFAMLACARIGAIHSVVFGGFASGSLAIAHRGRHAEGDRQRRRGLARRQGGGVQAAAGRGDPPVQPQARGRAAGGPRPGAHGAGRRPRPSVGALCARKHLDAQVPCEWLDSTDISYTIYTSGTTGKPKGVQRDTGGYAVALAASMKHIFGGKAGRNLFLHQRHRLGGGPQLHRLRPADRRHGDDHVRGPADPRPGRATGIWWQPGREVQGHAHVQRAHGGAGAEEAGPGLPEEIRPVQPEGAVPGRRAAGRAHRALDQRWPGRARSSTTTGRPRPAGRS